MIEDWEEKLTFENALKVVILLERLVSLYTKLSRPSQEVKVETVEEILSQIKRDKEVLDSISSILKGGDKA